MAYKKIFWVDIPKPPSPDIEEQEWQNVTTCDTREEAIQFIKDNFDSSSEDGKINLITEGVDGIVDEDEDTEG